MKQLLIACLVLFGIQTIAQDLKINWSNQLIYDNRKDGSMDGIIDENEKYIYTMYTDLGGRGKLRKIVAFDKNTMKKTVDVGLKGFPENKKEKKIKKKINYYKTVVYDDVIYVFWSQNTKTADEIYVESFDAELKKITSIKKVYELKKVKKSDKAPYSFVLSNKDVKGGRILLGGELAGFAGEPIKLEVKELNKDLSFTNSFQMDLPFMKIREKKKKLFSSGQYTGLSSSYTYGDDGNLHIKTSFSLTRKERKKRKKAGTLDDFIPLLYSSLNISTGELTTNQVKFENKNLKSFRRWITKDGQNLAGFFCDTEKDPGGRTTHGIFYAELSPTYKVKKVKFNYFTKKQLKELFKGDKEEEGGKKTCNPMGCIPGQGGCFGKTQAGGAADGDDAALASNYYIEEAVNTNDGIYLFCSRTRTYQTQHCSTDKNGNRTCYYVYHNKKSNVTGFQLDNQGKLGWASNIDRFKHYTSGSPSIYNIEDVHVVARDKGFYVIYEEGPGRTRKERKAKKKSYDKVKRPFVYAFFDKETGKFSKRQCNVNGINVKKKLRKTVTPTKVDVFHNEFFVTDTQIRIKPQWWWIAWWIKTPGMYKGKGYFGNIEVME